MDFQENRKLIVLMLTILHIKIHQCTTIYKYPIAFMENGEGYTDISIVMMNTGTSYANSSIYTKSNTVWSLSIAPGEFLSHAMPSTFMVTESGLSENGITVVSNETLAVYGLSENIDLLDTVNFEVFMGVSSDEMGLHYYAVTTLDNAQFLIVVENDQTVVTIMLKSTGPVTYRGNTYNDGEMIQEIIDKYDIVQVQSTYGDLTGSVILTNKPVSVHSGNKVTSININYENHLVEVLPPIDNWGIHYVTIPPITFPYNCKIVAGYEGTTVNHTCSDGNSGSSYLAGAGDFTTLPSLNSVCSIIASHPMLITMFVTPSSDPSMVVIQPLQELFEDLSFYVTGLVQNAELVVWTSTTTNTLKLDGVELSFSIIHTECELYGAQMAVSKGGHTITSEATSFVLSGYIHGFDDEKSISYPLLSTVNNLYSDQMAFLPNGCPQTQESTTSTMHTTSTISSPSSSTTSSTSSVSTESTTSTPITTSTMSSTSTESTTSTPITTSTMSSTSTESTTSTPITTSTMSSTSTESTTSTPITTSTTSTTSSESTASADTTSSTSESTSTTNHVTTSPNQVTEYGNMSGCYCKDYKCVTEYTSEELEEELEELKKELLINPNQTSLYLRSLTSAQDQRTSSKVIGYLAGTIMSAMAAGLFALDITNIISMFTTIKRNLMSV